MALWGIFLLCTNLAAKLKKKVPTQQLMEKTFFKLIHECSSAMVLLAISRRTSREDGNFTKKDIRLILSQN